MTTNLTLTELSTLEAMEQQAKNHQVPYWEIYQWLADTLQGKGVGSTNETVLWLRGATEANAGRGAFSALIRGYTETQYQLRYGTAIPEGKLQEASDEVAKNLLNDLLGRNQDWPKGQVPDIARIALSDATAVGDVLFGSKLGHSDKDTAFITNSAWSGTLLFSLLRSDQTARLMGGGGDLKKIDTLNDWRDVLYAYAAYKAGVKATIAGAATTGSLALIGTPVQKAQAIATQGVDLAIMGTTLYGYASSEMGDLQSAVLAGTPNPTLKAAFAMMGDTGANRFLDMLMGAVQGKFVQGSTTDANFAVNAKAFFGALTPEQLQSIGATLLPSSPAAIARLAQSDVNVRSALVAGSIVSVQISSALANSEVLALYDPVTRQGSLTEQWLDDRALFVSALGTGKPDSAGQLWRSASLPADRSFEFRYIDGQGAEQIILAENAARTGGVQSTVPMQLIYFGSDGANTINGADSSVLGDHLYAGGGDDTLNALGGNDYLEGNSGNDTLDGGAGNDLLLGGTGTDTYNFSGKWGNDVIMDADGLGKIIIDGSAALTGGKKLASNTWASANKAHTFTLTKSGDLVIRKGKELSAITVRGWQQASDKLGIVLDDTPYNPIAPDERGVQIKRGDQRAPTAVKGDGLVYYDWTQTMWMADGSLAGGIAEASFADVLYGTSAGSVLYGEGGNDVLAGGSAADVRPKFTPELIAVLAYFSRARGRFDTCRSTNNHMLHATNAPQRTTTRAQRKAQPCHA